MLFCNHSVIFFLFIFLFFFLFNKYLRIFALNNRT
nr:MAG TPA: hypothetical protein [Caudoviricetes sp.]